MLQPVVPEHWAGGSPDFDESTGRYITKPKWAEIRPRKRILVRPKDNGHEEDAHARDKDKKVKKHRISQDGNYGSQLTTNGTGAPPTSDWEHREKLDKTHAFDIRPYNNPVLRGLTSQPIKTTSPEEHAYAPSNTGSAAFTPYDQNATNLLSQQKNRNNSSGLRSTEHLDAPRKGRTLNDKSSKINPTHGYIPTQNQYAYQYSSGDHQGPNAPERNNRHSKQHDPVQFKSKEDERRLNIILQQAQEHAANGNRNPSGKKKGLTEDEKKMVITITLATMFAAGSITWYLFKNTAGLIWEAIKATGSALMAYLSTWTTAKKKTIQETELEELETGEETQLIEDGTAAENEAINDQGRITEGTPAEGEAPATEPQQALEGGAQAEGDAQGALAGGAQDAPEINQGQQAGNQAGEAGGESFSIDEGLTEGGGGEAPGAGAGAPESGAGVSSVEGIADANAVEDAALPIADAEFVTPSLEEANALLARGEEPSYMGQLYDFFKTSVLGQSAEYSNIAGLPEVPEPVTVRLPFSNQAVPLSETRFGTAEEAVEAGWIVEGGGSAVELEGGAGAALEAGKMFRVGAEGAEAVRMLEFARV